MGFVVIVVFCLQFGDNVDNNVERKSSIVSSLNLIVHVAVSKVIWAIEL